MAQSASLIAARVSALLDPEVTGLTPQLAQDPGPDSGAMILEYTAHAAAAEVRSLAATAASQTTTVQSGIESHANFAGHSARRTSDALARMSVAVSAELVLAVRALRLRGRAPSGPGVRRLYEAAAARLDAGHGRPADVGRPRGGAAAAVRGRAVDGGRTGAVSLHWEAERVDCASDEIRDLEALRVRPGLRELRLRLASPHSSAEHELSDLSPLAELRALEVVEVARSRVFGPRAAGGARGAATARRVARAGRGPSPRSRGWASWSTSSCRARA